MAMEAMEELVADTLYRTLRDFSTLVPRIVQSVMPSPLGNEPRAFEHGPVRYRSFFMQRNEGVDWLWNGFTMHAQRYSF